MLMGVLTTLIRRRRVKSMEVNMKAQLNKLILILTTALILALTSGCADNYNFTKAGCVQPNGQIGTYVAPGTCIPATQAEMKAFGKDSK
jgi:hypothetical protein